MKAERNIQHIRRSIYATIAKIDSFFGLENRQIIFSLHGVSNDPWYYNNSATFIKQMVKNLIKAGWQPGKLQDLKDNTRWNRKNFYLTFDDGYKSVLSITDFLYKNNIYPTAFLISDSKARDLSELTTNQEVMDKKDIQTLRKLGWEFGSHSKTHGNFYRLKSKLAINREVIDSKTELTKKYDIEVKYFAYPRGRYNQKIISQIKNAGYKYALTMDDALVRTNTKNYLIPRVGVDSSHTVLEAINSASPSVVLFRSIIKKILKIFKFI